MSEAKFPDGFYWGASTSAAQVEGGVTNDWTEWLQAHAQRLADAADLDRDFGNPGHVDSQKWADLSREAKDPAQYIAGRAVEHDLHWREDIELLREMGGNAYRFSLEWSKIEPTPGEFDDRAIEHYRTVLAHPGSIGMKPFVTLHHFANPTWFGARGWVESDAARTFHRFVEHTVPRLEAPDASWLVINEPDIYARAHSYDQDWPMTKKRVLPADMLKVEKQQVEAHKNAYDAIKSVDANSEVTSAIGVVDFDPAPGSLRPFNEVAAKVLDKVINRRFLDKTIDHMDFLALNTYVHCRINGKLFANQESEKSDLGWYLYPASLGRVARHMSQYGKPIVITEHGLADADDSRREWFTRESLKSLLEASEDGVDVRGYLHWSLLDNIEWDKGRWPKFGLVGVDPDTMQRRVKQSAYAYADIMRTNGAVL